LISEDGAENPKEAEHMINTAFYIVRPTATLLQKLGTCSFETALTLGYPVMWSRAEADRTAWTRNDYKEQIKLLFLAELASDYDGTTYLDLQQVLDELLGTPPWTVDTFDRWWQLERIEYDGDIAVIQNTLKTEFLLKLKSSSQVVTHWIELLINAKKL
jgi:hypothetical protein